MTDPYDLIEQMVDAPLREAGDALRCRKTFDGYRCRKSLGHKGHHYADTTNQCGVGWGNLREDGYPND